MSDLIIQAGGSVDGQEIFGLAVSGMSEMYGPGGYEMVLGDQPLDSRNSIWVQVYDMHGVALSAPVYIDTAADCGQNLILVNFSQLSALMNIKYFFPEMFMEP